MGDDESGSGPPPGEVTHLLRAAEGGSKDALDQLFALLYDRLRGMSHRVLAAHLRQETLSTTVLVHETYLKLSRDQGWTRRDRSHFLSIAARAMRQIVVDLARERRAQKRGSGERALPLEELEVGEAATAEQLLALHEAMASLAAVDHDLERIVELRFFAGLSLPEIGEVTGIPERTLKRRFRTARALLAEQLGLADPEAAGG